jgi:hypothetical protein
MRLCVNTELKCCDIRLHDAVCRQRLELCPKFGSSNLWIFEVTDRSFSSSLSWKVEQQSIAVLHTTLFSIWCHWRIHWYHFCSQCVAAVINYESFSNRHLYYDNTTIRICQTQSLSNNCTAIFAMLSFEELYRKTCWVFPTFYHSKPIKIRIITVWQVIQIYNPCYQFVLVWLPLKMCGRTNVFS